MTDAPGTGRRGPRWKRRAAIVLILAGYGTLILCGARIAAHSDTIVARLGLTDDIQLLSWALLVSVIVYVIATAIPFVPGAEIGLALLMVLGARAALLVYLATILSLALAFLVGRLVPEAHLVKVFQKLDWQRSSALVRGLSGKTAAERVGYLVSRAPAGWLPFLIRRRFLATLLLINLPGNSLVGGGGGIAMTLGISRIMSFPAFVLCIAIAVCPIPLAVILTALTTN